MEEHFWAVQKSPICAFHEQISEIQYERDIKDNIKIKPWNVNVSAIHNLLSNSLYFNLYLVLLQATYLFDLFILSLFLKIIMKSNAKETEVYERSKIKNNF